MKRYEEATDGKHTLWLVVDDSAGLDNNDSIPDTVLR